jgi:hypothetical protein
MKYWNVAASLKWRRAQKAAAKDACILHSRPQEQLALL